MTPEKPSESLTLLRTTFWLEYDRAQRTNEDMKIANVVSGVCAREFVEKHIFKCELRSAFIFKVPREYTASMMDLFSAGHHCMRAVLDLPIKNKNGVVNLQLVKEQRAIWHTAMIRLHGATPQKIFNVNANIDSGGQVRAPAKTVPSQQDIQKDIQKLQSELSALEQPPETPVQHPEVIADVPRPQMPSTSPYHGVMTVELPE
jgi:hypothetical protein